MARLTPERAASFADGRSLECSEWADKDVFRAVALLTIVGVRKNCLNVLPAVEHANDLGWVSPQTIKDNLRSNRQRTQAGADFVARPSREGEILD